MVGDVVDKPALQPIVGVFGWWFANETMKEFKRPETCPMTASGIF